MGGFLRKQVLLTVPLGNAYLSSNADSGEDAPCSPSFHPLGGEKKKCVLARELRRKKGNLPFSPPKRQRGPRRLAGGKKEPKGGARARGKTGVGHGQEGPLLSGRENPKR